MPNRNRQLNDHYEQTEMTLPIPKKLKHLSPIFEWFNALSEDEQNDDPITEAVVDLLKSHYCDFTFTEAENKLEADRINIGELAEKYGTNHSWLHFLYAFLNPHILPQLFDNLAKDSTDGIPPLSLIVALPEEFETTEEFGGISAKSDEVEITMFPTAESVLEFKFKNFKSEPCQDAATRCFTALEWDNVSGTKVSTAYQLPHEHKYITYLLKVPGGASVVEVCTNNSSFDETRFESYLERISVQNNDAGNLENAE